MADLHPVTIEELAEEAGLALQCLDKTFHEEHARLLAEFCNPWENIGYHLKLTKDEISGIKDDKGTTDLRRIAMLETWSEKFAHKATYRVLIEALIRSKRAKQALNLCQTLKRELITTGLSNSRNDDESVTTEQQATVCHNIPSDQELVPVVNITQSINQLEKQFICVQNQFLQSGIGTQVTLEKLKTCVSTLPSFTTDPQCLLKAESIDLFIFHLKKYCCALNPDILEGLIEVLGDAETKTMMEEYITALHEFQSKTKLKRGGGV